MRRKDLDKPLEERPGFEVLLQKDGKRRYTEVYYRDHIMAMVYNSPEPDGLFFVALYYNDGFPMADKWNVIMRKLGVDLRAVRLATRKFRINYNGGSSVVQFRYHGQGYIAYTFRDIHTRKRDCMCSKCLEKDSLCLENSSSSTTASSPKSRERSKGSPSTSTKRRSPTSKK